MDLVLVMKERLRDQSAEVRLLTRNYAICGGVGVILLLVSFLVSPPVIEALNSNTTGPLFSSTQPSTQASSTTGAHRSPTSSVRSSTEANSASASAAPAQVVTAGAFLVFFVLTLVTNTALYFAVHILQTSKFVVTCTSAGGSLRPAPFNILTRYIGVSPESTTGGYRSVLPWRAGAAPSGTPSNGTPASSSATGAYPAGNVTIEGVVFNSFGLSEVSLIAFPGVFLAGMLISQAAVMYGGPWWAVGLAMTAQVVVFAVRARHLLKIITIATK